MTLVELLVSISIIASLLAILLPSFSGARRDAKKMVCMANLRTVASGAGTYALENGDWLPLSPQYYDGEEHPEISATVVRMEEVEYDLLDMLGLYAPAEAFVCPSTHAVPIDHRENTADLVNTNYLFLWGTVYEVPGRVPPRINARSDYILAADFTWFDTDEATGDYCFGSNHTSSGHSFHTGTALDLSPETSPSALQYISRTPAAFSGMNGAKLDGSVAWYPSGSRKWQQGGPFNLGDNRYSACYLPFNPPWDRDS